MTKPQDNGLDGLQTFLDHAAGHSLLTAAEERELAKRIERGDLDAKNKLIESNVRLVVHVAKGYQHRGLPLEDLIQEGMIGLVRAAEKFDWRRGHKFSTYGIHWIRQAIDRGLADKGRPIRMPVHQVVKLQRIRKAERELLVEVAHDPTTEEIAERAGLPAHEVDELVRIARPPASLNKLVGNDEESELGDFIPDDHGPRPFDVAASLLQRASVQAALEQLPYRLRRVLEMRHGLDDDQPRTLDEISRVFDVTRERVRQIELQALDRLRETKEAEALRAT